MAGRASYWQNLRPVMRHAWRALAWVVAASAAAGLLPWLASGACDSARSNFGWFIAHECMYFSNLCAHEDACESDECYCESTGATGYIKYCVAPEYCGYFPGCNPPGTIQCPSRE